MLRRSWLILLYIINQWFQYSSKISGGLWKFPREEDFLGALQKFWAPPPLILNYFKFRSFMVWENEVFFPGGKAHSVFQGGTSPQSPPISRHAEKISSFKIIILCPSKRSLHLNINWQTRPLWTHNTNEYYSSNLFFILSLQIIKSHLLLKCGELFCYIQVVSNIRFFVYNEVGMYDFFPSS